MDDDLLVNPAPVVAALSLGSLLLSCSSSDFSQSAACRLVRPSINSFSNRSLVCGGLSKNRVICSRFQSKDSDDRPALRTSPSNASNNLTFQIPHLFQASAMQPIWDPPQQDPAVWRLLWAVDSYAQEATARTNLQCLV